VSRGIGSLDTDADPERPAPASPATGSAGMRPWFACAAGVLALYLGGYAYLRATQHLLVAKDASGEVLILATIHGSSDWPATIHNALARGGYRFYFPVSLIEKNIR
jgi:hypothetical protein